MAELLLRDRLARAGADVTVSSAGGMKPGSPSPRGAIRAMAARGLALDEHRSRRTTVAQLERADLVLGMAREHVRAAVVMLPGAFPRTFTLKDLVRRAEAAGPRDPAQPLRDWLAVLHAGRRAEELLGDDPSDDVADPIGGPDSAYEATARELEGLLGRLVALVLEPGAVSSRRP